MHFLFCTDVLIAFMCVFYIFIAFRLFQAYSIIRTPSVPKFESGEEGFSSQKLTTKTNFLFLLGSQGPCINFSLGQWILYSCSPYWGRVHYFY